MPLRRTASRAVVVTQAMALVVVLAVAVTPAAAATKTGTGPVAAPTATPPVPTSARVGEIESLGSPTTNKCCGSREQSVCLGIWWRPDAIFCLPTGGWMPWTDNTPAAGWNQLYSALNGDPATTQKSLPFSTDIKKT